MYGAENGRLPSIISLCDYAIEKSPFYRQTLKQPQTWEDFFSLPILTGEQLRQNVDPQRNNSLLTASPKGAVLVSSSASTGPRKLIYREYREQQRISRRLTMALRLAGITAEDQVANMFIPGNLAGAWIGMHEAIQLLGATVLPIGNAISTAEQSKLIHWLQPTALVGMPSTLIQLLAQHRPSVQKVLCGGEGLNSKIRTDLETSLGLKIPLVYGNVECGIVGIQCEEIHGSNQYHINDEDLFVEIIDSATGKPCTEGEIIVTHLHRRLQPLIRYRLGDLGKWVNSPCKCGLSSPRIEFICRATDELVKVNGITIKYNDLESAMADHRGYLGRCQIRVNRTGEENTVKIIVEAENLTCEDIYAAIYSRLPEVSNLHRQGILTAEVVQRGDMPTLPTHGGKALHIVDER